MEKVQKDKINLIKYLVYLGAVLGGIGLGFWFSQYAFSDKKVSEKTQVDSPDLTNKDSNQDSSLSEQEANQLIAERANLLAESTPNDSAPLFDPHGGKVLNPIEIEKLNQEVKNFDPATKAGSQNSDRLIKVTWEMLKNVKFEERYYEEIKAYLLFPVFGKPVKELDGKDIYIRGFIIPADEVNNIYVLSANSYASCFFCGNAGPESVMDLDLQVTPELKEKLQLDAVFTFKGRLKLNSTNIDRLNYILEDAELYE